MNYEDLLFIFDAPYSLQISYLIFFGVLGCLVYEWGIGFRGAKGRRLEIARDAVKNHGWALLMLAIFTVAACIIPAFETLHDHNSFVRRSDSAYDWTGSVTAWIRWGPHAWLPPSMHIYGILLHSIPGQYGVEKLLFTSLILTVSSAGLFYLFVRRLVCTFGYEIPGKYIALWSLGFLLVHPAFLRLAVGGTLWPYTAMMLWGAALCGLHAIRGGSLRLALAASGLLCFATTSSAAVLTLGLLIFVAPICWRDKSSAGWRVEPHWRWLVPVGCGLAFMSPYGIITLNQIVEHGGLGRDLSNSIGNLLYADARVTPVLWLVLALLGFMALLRNHLRISVPILYALIVSEAVLGAQVRLFTGYPTRFIHGYLSFFFFGLLAGVGAVMLTSICSRVRGAPVILAALCIGFIPTTGVSLSFLTESRVLGRELWAIERALPDLPPHDCLVIPPSIFLTERPEVKLGSDPVEAQFPKGAYFAAMEAAGLSPSNVQSSTGYLDEPCTGEALFYLGSTFRTWLRGEIAAGLVPENTVDREPLQRLLTRYSLEPVREFTLSTHNPVHAAMRLAADRTDEVTLGFYRMWPKAPSSSTPGADP